jgi:adenosylcobyric acid synthase
MDAREYFEYKKSLLPEIKAAYDALAAEYDVIVIEGAGSPAEINLKENDIVNMGMARMADAPVLLVGDIDRGGVFAQLLGTVELLEEEERARIKGLIINKFRGDASILKPGIIQLREYLDMPVVGVVPYMRVDIEDEDSQASRLERRHMPGLLDFAVIRLPHMANFTDFLILEQLPQVSVRYEDRPDRLGTPDLILLPGSKNTLGDMAWLRTGGMEAAIAGAYAKGSVLFGICGGYQLLGRTISDPERTEAGGTMAGLGYLPVDTVYKKQKIRTRVRGTLQQLPGVLSPMSGLKINGYETHMGVTTPAEPLPQMTSLTVEQTGEKKPDGAVGERVYGTYVHGIFDREGVASALAAALAKKKGITLEVTGGSMEQYREEQFDLLADTLRKHLDLKAIYEVMDL